MYWSIGIQKMESGSRIATANTARQISIANRALAAVACIDCATCERLVMLVRAATIGRISCITVEYRFVRDWMHCQ